MNQLKTCDEVLKDLGVKFKFQEFEQEWINNNYFEISQKHISKIVDGVTNYYKQLLLESEDENATNWEIEYLISNSMQSNEALVHQIYADRKSIMNFSIIRERLVEALNELLKTNISNEKTKIQTKFHCYEISILLNHLIKNKVFSEEATKAEISTAFAKLTGYNSKTIQNNLGKKALESYAAGQYKVKVKNLLRGILNSMD
jgi:hypothetical protein